MILKRLGLEQPEGMAEWMATVQSGPRDLQISSNYRELRDIWRRMSSGMLLAALLLVCTVLAAEPIRVRNPEGTLHAFLALSTLEGKKLASGDLTQVIRGDRVTMRMTFHFQDGSVDDETTVFTQSHAFRVISDHHVQSGPSFPHPMDVMVDCVSGHVVVKYREGGKEKQIKDRVNLPADLSNGLLAILIENLPPGAPETRVSYLAATPSPRLVKLAISLQGENSVSSAGFLYKVKRYVVKTEIGGAAGLFAPLVGKQPKDIQVWILDGVAPTFMKLEAQLYQDGPMWRIEMTSPIWQ